MLNYFQYVTTVIGVVFQFVFIAFFQFALITPTINMHYEGCSDKSCNLLCRSDTKILALFTTFRHIYVPYIYFISFLLNHTATF